MRKVYCILILGILLTSGCLGTGTSGNTVITKNGPARHMIGLVTDIHTVASADTWYNITFDPTLGSIDGFTFADNRTVIIEKTGHYTITFGMGFLDSAANPVSHVAMRISKNGAEVDGSYVEGDPFKQDADFWLEHTTHVHLNAGDQLNMQYISSHTTVTIEQEETYAVQGFHCYGYIQEV